MKYWHRIFFLLFLLPNLLWAAEPKANKIRINDVGNYFTGTEVETALQELGAGSAAVTIDTNVDDLFTLTGQAFSYKTQTANYIFGGPATGVAAVPAFRALVDADIPNNITITEVDPIVAAINGIIKSNGTTISAASAGTDYVIPSGSVATLTTPRAINGTNFDGSAAITIPVNNANDATNAT